MLGHSVCVFFISASSNRLLSSVAAHGFQAFNTVHPCQCLDYPAFKFVPSNMCKMKFIVLLYISLIIEEFPPFHHGMVTSWEAKITQSCKAWSLFNCHFAFYKIFTDYLVSLSISFLICKIWNKNSNLLMELLLSHYYLIIIVR